MDIEQCFHIDNAFISMNQFSGIPYSKSLEILILSPSNILAVICSRWLVAVRNGFQLRFFGAWLLDGMID